MKNYAFGLILVLTALFINGCAPNKPWRGNNSPECGNKKEENCTLEKHCGYELGFIEFSERGNLFDVKSKDIVLNKIRTYSKENGVVVVVFVHGWKHNAKFDDKNVESFRSALETLSKNKLLKQKKVVGVYVGWGGLSFHGLQAENTTFWDRKAVAQEVGKGGITELFLELEQIDSNKTENILAIVGHSFGGAIVLSALDEILLERLIFKKNHPKEKLKYFGDAVVLINPAIEANQAFQLQEVAREIDLNQKDKNGSIKNPTKILHVISSEGDLATKYVFPIGQFLGTALTWNQEKIKRKYGNCDYNISEYDLDLTTVGNFKPFHTANLIENPKINKQLFTENGEKAKPGDIVGDMWKYEGCCTDINKCKLSRDSKYHLPCTESYPISFLYTAKSFIDGHNDIFNCNITSYLLATISEALFYQNKDNASERIEQKDFNFSKTFKDHLNIINTQSGKCDRK